jgi:hypothetical protein
MKNRNVTVLFKFNKVESGVVLVGTKKPVPGMVYLGKFEQRFDTNMPPRSFTQEQYGDRLTVLTEEQLDVVFEENIDTLSREEVEAMFDFELRRGSAGHVWLIQEPHNRGTTSEMIQRNVSIIAQMVRFGFLNKMKLKSTR